MKRLTDGRLLWGLVIIALGVLWLLNNMGVAHVHLGVLIKQWWPVILVYFGILGIEQAVPHGSRAGQRQGVLVGSLVINALLLAVGVVLLGNNNGWFYADINWIWGAFFPLVVVLVGVSLLTGGIGRQAAHTYWAVMAGADVQPKTWTDTAVVAVMGGAKLDMSQAGLPERGVLLDVHALMGGVEIRVPEGVGVMVEWTGFMGGVSLFGKGDGALFDRKELTGGEGPQIRVRARTIMGGVDIKHPKHI
ncbi:MAG: LiaI-LiaF-like domain-containing protein [Mycobacterium leprae]